MIEQLTRDNPQLLVLEAAYRTSPHWDVLMKGSAWEAFSNGIDLQRFRGEAMYQTQLLFGATEKKYYNTWEYIVSLGLADWLTLGEDGDFGCITFPMGMAHCISRDLLDSILEIAFLREMMGLTIETGIHVADIGSGYGRFAHRFTKIFPHAWVNCYDAVPVSTFLSKFYLNYRGVSGSRQFVTPLSEIGAWRPQHIDVGVTIHSWSECKPEAIAFWLDYLVDLNVKYLMVVSHDDRWICVAADGSHPSFKPLIEAHGYRCKVERPKYPAGVDGIYPEVVFSFWER